MLSSGRSRPLAAPPGDAVHPGVAPEAEVSTVKKALGLGALMAIVAGIGKFIMGRRHGDEEDA